MEITKKDLKCPVCSNPVNWLKNVGDVSFNRTITLLAECWSGDTAKDMPEHLFLIKLNNLPEMDLTEDVKSE